MLYRITWKTHVICLFISTAIIAIFYTDVIKIVDEFLSFSLLLYPSYSIILNFYIPIILLTIIASILHEIIHAGAYKIFGGKAEIGYKLIYAYTRETSGKPIVRIKFIAILLLPLLLISVLLFPSGVVGRMIFLINLMGSSGDIYMVFVLLRYGKNCSIVDRSYGFDVIEGRAE